MEIGALTPRIYRGFSYKGYTVDLDDSFTEAHAYGA